MEEMVERLQCRESALHRAGLVATLHHRYHPIPRHIRVDGFPGKVAVETFVIRLKRLQVVPILAYRPFRQAALIAQIIEKSLKQHKYLFLSSAMRK